MRFLLLGPRRPSRLERASWLAGIGTLLLITILVVLACLPT
jgi:hypothetical protein